MHPSPLRGLRTNCLLAPLTSAVVGALAILVAWGWQQQTADLAEAAAHRDAISGLARLHEAGHGPAAAVWLAAHPEWVGVGRYTLTNDRLDCLDAAGCAGRDQEPEPELILAFQEARTWGGARRLAAAPCLPMGQPSSVVVGWWQPPAPVSMWPWLALAGGVILIGGGLGVYLVARVYRPVLWLERAAQAAAMGAPEPDGRIESAETASLRSSLRLILDKQPRDHDQPPA